MYHCAAAGEGHDKAAHEIDGMIRGNDAEITRAGPKRKNRSHRHALLEIILVREDAAFGATSRTGGINDARGIFALPLREHGLARIVEFLPAFCSTEIGTRERFANDYGTGSEALESVILREGAPQMIFGDENFRFRVGQKLQMLGRGEFIVERNEHAASEKNRVRGNQPF